MPRSEHSRGLLLVFVAALLWSSGGIAIKSVDASPLVIAALRSGIAAVALFLYFRPRVAKLTWSFLLGVISYAACLTTFVVATRLTTAANAIFLQYIGVFWVMLLSPLMLKEPLKRRDVIAIACAFAGMALFFIGEFEARGLAGNLFAVVSSIFFALLIIALRIERNTGAEAVICWGNVLVAAAIIPFTAGQLRLDRTSWLVLIWLGVIQIGLAYMLFVAGIKRLTATQASLVGMIEPIANPIWVFLFLGERPKLLALAGAVIVLAAISWRTFSHDETLSGLPAAD